MRKQKKQIWFITGSQHLYGPETLRAVDANSREIVSGLSDLLADDLEWVHRPVVTTPEAIREVCLAANAEADCVGLVAWMHTFSPAKMWIGGLKALQKPLCHLHTQFNRDIPWSAIDMDFMNLNQSAHGGREFGHIMTRLGLPRKVIVGHWQNGRVRAQASAWAAVALGWNALQSMKVVRFGDNMRQVAVTEGDKVAAEITFGMSVNTHGVGDLIEVMEGIPDSEVDALCDEYFESYDVQAELQRGGERHESLREAARIEAALRKFLEAGGYGAFTDTFEDLHGLPQLPGLAVQRLMAEGYGFGGEGDWKQAALVRLMKIMGGTAGRGASFMEDYTYHFDPSGSLCLGSHMLEICPSISGERPRVEIHPLGIGGKADPVRLVFNAAEGPAINVSLVDLGHRFRLLVNKVKSVPIPEDMPNLPVARVLWEALPNLETAAQAWILAGGAHHTAFSFDVDAEQIQMLAEMAGVELIQIDEETTIRGLQQELRVGEVYYGSGRRS